MDPNLQQLLWAAYPLACFWYGFACRDDLTDSEGLLGGLLIILAILGHFLAIGFIIYSVMKAFHVVP